MLKSAQKKIQILETALQLTRKIGIESLSIGELAKSVGMSKSGLFAHFRSKEKLQIMVIDHAATSFVSNVIKPAIKVERGVKRLKKLIQLWVEWSLKHKDGSCPLITAAIEFDDRPGEVRLRVQRHLKQLHQTLARACELCVETGEFKKTVDVDQISQEIFSFILSYHLYLKTIDDTQATQRFNRSIEGLIQRQLKGQ